MNYGENDLVWVPKELAKKLKELTDTDAINREILNHIEEVKQDLKSNVNLLDEEILVFRANMINARNNFKQCKDEQLNSFEDICLDFLDDSYKYKEKVKSIREILSPLIEDLNYINDSIRSINTWQIDNFVETLKHLNSLSDSQKEILKKII